MGCFGTIFCFETESVPWLMGLRDVLPAPRQIEDKLLWILFTSYLLASFQAVEEVGCLERSTPPGVSKSGSCLGQHKCVQGFHRVRPTPVVTVQNPKHSPRPYTVILNKNSIRTQPSVRLGLSWSQAYNWFSFLVKFVSCWDDSSRTICSLIASICQELMV